MKKISIIALLMVFSAVAVPVLAADFIAPKDKNSDVSIQPGQPPHNLYTVANNININSDVTGDIYAAGSVINVLGKTEKDLNLAGQSIVVNGAVGSNARLAGANINVTAPIGDDLLSAGSTISIAESSNIGGDLIAAANDLNVNAPVNGNVKIAGKSIRINSRINGDIDIRAENLTFGPGAVATGNITFKGPNPAVIENGASVSNINYEKREAPKAGGAAKRLFGWFFLFQIIGLFIAGWLLSRNAKNHVENVVRETSKNPLLSLGIGVLFLIFIPILVVVLAISIIGWYLAFLLIFSYLAMIVLSMILASVFLGSVIFQWYRKGNGPVLTWFSILVGAILYRLIGWVPVVGWAVTLILVCMIFGTLVRMMKPGMAAGSKEPVPPANQP